MKLLLNILMLTFCLMSCENTATEDKQNAIKENERIEKTAKETVAVQSNQSSCDYLPEAEVRSIFGLDVTAKLDIDESDSKTYKQCLYYFDKGYMYIIKYLDIPPPFKGDNEAFLEHIFKQYEGDGNQARPSFERLNDLDFSAGWTSDDVKILGNTIDFVVDNERYAIHVKFIPNNGELSKEKAIELAKIIKN